MKKLIFGLLTLITGNLYADSITNGSVGLLKVSTGVAGTRNWGDKYNENFQIIANTITTIQNNISTLNSAIASSNTAIYTAINSTNTNLYSTVLSTFQSLISYEDTMNSTTSRIIISTSSLETKLSQRTVVGYNNGVALSGGNITAINVVGTAVQSGSSLTITAAAASSGGSGQSPYSMVVGSFGATGVDAIVSNLQQFNLALASLSACGLTTSATGFGTIYFKDGIYPFAIGNATVPAGIYIQGGSSVVWQSITGTNTLVTVYGRMDGIKFDLEGTGIACKLIDLKTNSRLTNFQIYNATGLAKSPTLNTYAFDILSVNKSSNIIIQGEMREFNWPTGSGNYGDNAPFKITSSSYVDVRVNMTPFSVDASASVGIYIANSNYVNIHDSIFDAVGGNLAQFDSGNSDCFFERNKVIITRVAGDNGIIVFAGQTSGVAQISTGTMSISNNDFEIRTIDAGNIVQANGNGGSLLACGIRLKNNTVHATTTGAGVSQYKFATFQAVTKGAVIQNNNCTGITQFIADSGADTLYTSQGNAVYGVEQ